MTTITDPDVAFDTERCWVRDWRPSDVDRAFDIYSRWEVAKWLGATPKAMEDRADAERLIDGWGELNRTEPPSGRWAVERKADGVVAGTIILVPFPDGDGEYEVGWHFHPDSWGRGLASESARGALAWAFTHGLREVSAVLRPTNERSRAVCVRIGMTGCGLTSRYYDTELELFRIVAPE